MADFFYNGVPLPEVPENPYDEYSHRVIAGPYTLDGYDGVYYFLGGCDKATPTGFPTNIKGTFYDSCVFSRSYLATTEELSNALNDSYMKCGVNTWGEVRLASYDGVYEIDNIFWTNIDILNTDGTLYLAASAPIPVAPSEPVNPAAMLTGWQLGQMVAGMRKRSDTT